MLFSFGIGFVWCPHWFYPVSALVLFYVRTGFVRHLCCSCSTLALLLFNTCIVGDSVGNVYVYLHQVVLWKHKVAYWRDNV